MLAVWFAVAGAAAHAQTQGEPTAPGQVGAGNARGDHYAPAPHRWAAKWVLSHVNALEVSWRPPANDGGSPVTAYRIYWYRTGDYAGTVQSRDVAPSGTGAQIYYLTGLTNGVEYGVGVTAVNAAGEGPFRNGSGGALASLPFTSPRDDAFINTPNARDDMEVGSLAATAVAPNTLRVTWTAPTGTRVLSGYKVYWAMEGRAAADGSAWVAKATARNIGGLVGGQEYRITVTTTYTRDAGDEGTYDATAVTRATAYGAPTVPRDLVALGHDRSLAVSWAAPAADGGSPVTGYRLSWSAADGSTGSVDLGADARAHTIPDLGNGRPYTVTLAAFNAHYTGPVASGGDTPFSDTVPSFGDATVAAQTRTVRLPGAPALTLPAASGGNFGLSYRLSPAVRGLTFDPETRVLSGTATEVVQHQMTYRADDGDRFTTAADAAILTFTLTVNSNTAPTAAPIAKSTHEEIPLSFAKSDFTAAFSDPDPGDSLSGLVIEPPAATHGTLTLAGTRVTLGQFIAPDDLDTLVFTPAAGYSGAATFAYHLADQPGGVALRATATITVHPNDPPIAAASTAPYGSSGSGRTVTLTNASRDPDGDAMSWRWEQTAGTTVALSDASAESPTFTAPNSVGWLTFRLTATDEHGATGTDTASLRVYTPPGAPATLTTTPGDGDVTLTWTPGAANGNPISGWQYRVSADGGANWGPWWGAGRSLIYSKVVTGLVNDTAYTFAVRAKNGAGYGTARTITATPEANPESNRYAPRARAGDPQTVATGATVTLDASGSSDWDYTIRFYFVNHAPVWEYDHEQEAKDFTYLWTQVRTRTDTPLVTLDDATALKPTFTAPDEPTQLVFRLTVSDGEYSDDTETTISVVRPAGTPSFGAATRSLFLGLRPNDTLSRELPAATGGNGGLTYGLTPPAPGVMAFDAATRKVTLTPTAVGSWTFDYTATDADGDADTIPLSVRVAEVSTAPTFGGVSISDMRLVKGQLARGHVDRPLLLPRATGGEGPLAYSLQPEVPGLTFDPRTRKLQGRTTTAGSYVMTYRAVDSDADASDADSATLRFTIEVVENSAPVALFPGETVRLRLKVPMAKWRHTERDLNRYPYAVDFRDYFYDPDGRDSIWIKSRPYPPFRAALCPDNTARCGYLDQEGTWTVDVTAADLVGGATATQRFHVTGLPANRAPVARAETRFVDIRNGLSMGRYGTTPGCRSSVCRWVVSGYFSDPDGDPLTYRPVSSDPRLRAYIRIIRNSGWGDTWGSHPTAASLHLQTGSARAAAGNWSATVTVSATDPEGESAYIDVPVTVRNEPWEGGPPLVPPEPGAPSFGDATVAGPELAGGQGDHPAHPAAGHRRHGAVELPPHAGGAGPDLRQRHAHAGGHADHGRRQSDDLPGLGQRRSGAHGHAELRHHHHGHGGGRHPADLGGDRAAAPGRHGAHVRRRPVSVQRRGSGRISPQAADRDAAGVRHAAAERRGAGRRGRDRARRPGRAHVPPAGGLERAHVVHVQGGGRHVARLDRRVPRLPGGGAGQRRADVG